MTLGITPILANQLAHPAFRDELETFLAQRIEACREAAASFGRSGEEALIPVARSWHVHFERLRRLFHRHEGDLIGAFRRLEHEGRLELMSSAATHGFLPLLGRDESIRLQLGLGRREHRRLFGREPAGCWLPECAYRGPGAWQPLPAAIPSHRVGLEDFLSGAGFRYCFTDAHLALAGESLELYGEREPADGLRLPAAAPAHRAHPRSPYRTYRLRPSDPAGAPVAVLVRDPESSLRVWSRYHGYPGDPAYLEFHKIRWPGGLRFWRVSGRDVDLGAKEPYDPNVARARAYRHARDLAERLARLAETAASEAGEVIAVPFDTELFGHWWFEGVDFLADLFRALPPKSGPRPSTASDHLARARSSRPAAIRLTTGSWGAQGDFSMWLNPATEWTWERLWSLEDRFWDTARRSRGDEAAAPLLAQATRELLLAQASDWQFIISTGAAADYGVRRFREHCDGLSDLLDALDAPPAARGGWAERAERLAALDDPFPDVQPALRAALDGA